MLNWLTAGPALAFDALFVFGDSLTDTGREPAEPLFHYMGRWSNGPLWVEYLSTKLGLAYNSSNNFAHSGAQVDDLLRQLDDFVPPPQPANAIYVAWAGGNDFLQSYKQNLVSEAAWDRQIDYSISNYSRVVLTLYDKGARTILVPNTVDLTHIPSVNYIPSIYRDYIRGKVRQFNTELASALDRVGAEKPELRLIRADTYARFENLLRNAAAYGFTETERDVLSNIFLFPYAFDGPGRNYVFWDPIHPTTKAHALIADWFYEAILAAEPPRLGLSRVGNDLSFFLTSLQTNQAYVLERTTNLATWTDVQTVLATNAAQQLTLVTNDLPSAFFRLRLQP